MNGTRRAAALLSAVLCMGACTADLLPAAANDPSEWMTVTGDVNGDGSFTVSDIVALQKWLLAVPDAHPANPAAGDLDADGTLDVYDLALMKWLLLNPVPPEPQEPEDPGTPIASSLKSFTRSLPTTGDVRMLSVFVDFADAKYRGNMYSNEQLREELFGNNTALYPYESLTVWFDRASYGNLHLDGDVYRYTCSGNLSDYMSAERQEPGYERMVTEVLAGLDGQINFADYDSDQDGVIDCISFTVPLDDADEATKKYWRGCTSTWFVNPEFTVDGESIVKYIILDEMPYQDQMVSVKRTLAHEMGHCMGLPDYYKYNDDDWEGLRGIAGNERMDDSVGDFCSFSKLMCGWLKDTEVQAYDGSGTQTFTLEDASRTGSCLILPISSAPTDYTSEYFLVEYVSDTGNNSENFYGTSGVRIFHVQSELYTDAWWRTRFRYENYAETYLGNDKIRVLRLVNDNGDFYHTGDTVTYGTTNFAGYDANGYQTVNTGYTITIGELTDAGYTVTVSR